MTKPRGLVLIVLMLGFGYVGIKWYERFPWIEAAAYAHSQRHHIDCGHVVEPDYPAALAATNCATSAHEKGSPFIVMFSVHGIDYQITNAVIGDSKAGAIEIEYATGMVTAPNTLLRRRCSVPVQLQVEPATTYHILRLHCAPWPPTEFEKDHVFW
jgi:hypothetical protein